MTMNLSKHIFSTDLFLVLFLVGCSLKVEHTAPSDETPKGGEVSPTETMLTTLATSDQQKMFGPFPCWKTHEGSYQYQSFMMRYLLNDETQMCDINKSWIGALYRDTSFSNRYSLKFVVRQRFSESQKWQIVDTGNILFVLNGNEVQIVDYGESSRHTTTIAISVCEDIESYRYLQIKISGRECHDEFRTFIKP